MQNNAGVYEFVGIGEMAETTTHLLLLYLQQTSLTSTASSASMGQVEQLVLQQARDYLAKVREGFILSVRDPKGVPKSELRYLLAQVVLDWSQLSEELGLEDFTDAATDNEPQTDETQLVPVQYQLLAFGMAMVALGALPRLPSKQITFPHSFSQPPTYADIPIPVTPGEMLARIDELEQTIWRLMSTDLDELVQQRYGPLRRTYGFFEASAWLSRHEAERFGIKKRRDSLTLF